MYVISKWNQDLRSSGMLSSVRWYLRTDVSGQPIGPIFKSQPVQEGCPGMSTTNYQHTPCNIIERAKSLTILRQKPEVAQMGSKLTKQV